jgi:hypothetical protein
LGFSLLHLFLFVYCLLSPFYWLGHPVSSVLFPPRILLALFLARTEKKYSAGMRLERLIENVDVMQTVLLQQDPGQT